MEQVESAIKELVKLPITALEEFQGNLKDLTEENYARAKKSILKLKYSFAVHAWENEGKYYILDGHQRVRAMLKMADEGYAIPSIPTVLVEADSFKQAKEKVLAGTSQYGQMTGQGLYEFISESQLDWRDVVRDNRFPEIEPTAFIGEFYGETDGAGGGGGLDPDKYTDEKEPLAEKYIVPPFSVLDSRQGYWLTRKSEWREEIGDGGESRENVLSRANDNLVASVNDGTSLLDPVLAEVLLKWFAPPKSNVLDPFAGDTIFGYVAKKCGHHFTGIELRSEQAGINNERCNKLKGKKYGSAKYYCDSSENVDTYVEPETQDFVFTCPPYYNLEVYSQLPGDLSNQDTYEDFKTLIYQILLKSVHKLKDNRFAAIVISDIRDGSGVYRNMCMDVMGIMLSCGLQFYNDLVLINSVGTAPLRANKYMRTRKVVRLHQNVLVFYKGDVTKIKENFPALTEEAETDEALPSKD